MCGIFGVTGLENKNKTLIEGIQKLEYRGYDSAGIAFFDKKQIKVIKAVGEIKALEKVLEEKKPEFLCGIAHTRWATHGKPSKDNAHPHFSSNKQFALIHNGIIENFKELQDTYLKEVAIKSQTDSEIVVKLIEKMFDGNILSTFKKVCEMLKGSYAFCLIYKKEPNKIYVTRHDSPLTLANINNTSYVASDVSAIVGKAKKQFLLKNNDYAILTPKDICFFDSNLNEINYELTHINELTKETQIGVFSHFMKKEIYEIKDAVISTLNSYPTLDSLYNIIPEKLANKITHIKLVACGTAYHAGLIAKKVIKTMSPTIEVETLIASEFRYSNPHFKKNTLCIFISQSGETADTLACVELCSKLGAKTLAVTNVKNSSITYLADYNLYTSAGREVAVASTKAYNSQVALLYLISTLFVRGNKIKQFLLVQQEVKSLFLDDSLIKNLEKQIIPLAKKYSAVKSIYFIGRQLDYDTAQEASLKLKEITYIHCEAYPAGELKHGTLSLIEEGTLVICFLTQQNIIDKTLNGLFEVKSRGANVLLVTNQTNIEKKAFDEQVYLPFSTDLYLPIISIIPMQLLAYHISTIKGINPDKPRNLAKAVTVE